MGRGLYAAHPAFRQALDEVCRALDAHLDRPLRDVMWAEPGTAEAGLLDHTLYTQSALFAVETALYRLLESQGRPPGLAGRALHRRVDGRARRRGCGTGGRRPAGSPRAAG
ncbi:acyltransferase domain-containing protein [Streptomyces tricolor]|nr:acyltransferase domain-containing protein [Streptomyces tricolor]